MNYNLERFKTVQDEVYEQVIKELKNGKKESHWIWYIFPQLKNLGFSYASEYYGISDINEAKAYLSDELLRSRLFECSNLIYNCEKDNIEDILYYPDDLKLCSSMTLFHLADPTIQVFSDIITKYYDGIYDQNTIDIINSPKLNK